MSKILTTTTTETVTEPKRKPKTVYPPYETCGKTNHSTENSYHRANAANRPSSGREDRKDKTRSKKKPIKMTQTKLLRLQPKF